MVVEHVCKRKDQHRQRCRCCLQWRQHEPTPVRWTQACALDFNYRAGDRRSVSNADLILARDVTLRADETFYGLSSYSALA